MAHSDPRPLQAPPTIGVLISYFHVGEVYSAGVLHGIHAAVQQRGGRLIVFQEYVPHQMAQLELASAQIDGWVVILNTEGTAELAAIGKPVVTVASAVAGLQAVMTDNRGGVGAAVEHLTEHGHRRIGFVGWQGADDLRERFLGYRAALEAAGIEHDPELVALVGGNDQSDGFIGGQRLLAATERPTAIIAGTDSNAIGVMQALAEAGLRVPEDVAVIGFDDIEGAQYTAPPLTTIRQSPERLGQVAVGYLFAQFAHGPQDGISYVATELVVRRSCGCAMLATGRDGGFAEIALDQRARAGVERLAARLASGTAVPTLESEADGIELVDLETLNKVMMRLEAAATDLLDREDDPATRRRIMLGLQQQRQQLLRTYQRQEKERNLYLAELVYGSYTSYRVTLPLLERGSDEILSLDWLIQSKATWGCVALWDGAREQLVIKAIYTNETTAPGLAAGRSYAPAAFPPIDQMPVLAGGPDLIKVFRIKTASQDDEWGFLVICGHIVSYHEHIGMWAHMIGAVFDREALVSSITRAKQAAEEANRLKTQFLSMVSHELRTPLNAILGFAELLQDDQFASKDRRRHLQERLMSNSQHLLGLINDVLDLARIEAGRLDLAPEPVDLEALVEGLLPTVTALAQDKQLDVEVVAPPNLPRALADPLRIRQVLLNLLSNAIKFTERGTITVTLAQTADMLEVAVSDTGIGIAPEDQALIFEQFRQVHTGPSRQYQGSGLGLPICRQLIELHRGRLWVESQPGSGATFRFTLPLAPVKIVSVEQPPHRPQPIMVASEGELQQTLKTVLTGHALVLVVDDYADAREILRTRLEALGYRVREAANGEEALDSIRAHRPDLILLDLMMPQMDGFELMQHLRDDPLLGTIPVIVLTAQMLSEPEMKRLNAGVAVLEKGVFSTDEVLTHAANILEGQQPLGDAMPLLVRGAMAYIHDHFDEPISRETIAAYVGVSPRHLTRVFQQQLGIAPLTYITRYRINHAKHLLASRRISVAEVAKAVGFANEFSFSRLFRREVGVSPGAYRRGER